MMPEAARARFVTPRAGTALVPFRKYPRERSLRERDDAYVNNIETIVKGRLGYRDKINVRKKLTGAGFFAAGLDPARQLVQSVAHRHLRRESRHGIGRYMALIETPAKDAGQNLIRDILHECVSSRSFPAAVHKAG